MIERFAIGVACPFGKAAEIPHKRVSLGAGAGHDDMVAIDFPNHLIAWFQAKREAHSAWNSGLRLRGYFAENHGTRVRTFLTSGNDQSRPLASGITATVTPASASAHRAPGFSRSGGSASAHRHRQGAVPPCRHRSAREC